jgi:hypothetical protein
VALWDRQDEETQKSYDAFCVYRDLKPRSLQSAYRKGSGKEQAKQASGCWLSWYDEHDWKRRAEAYDAHLELLSRQRREADHLQELDAYRNRQKQLAAATIHASITLLQKSSERLKDLKPEEIETKMLPAFFRAAAAVAETATNSEAQALAVEELLRALNASPGGSEADGSAGL